MRYVCTHVCSVLPPACADPRVHARGTWHCLRDVCARAVQWTSWVLLVLLALYDLCAVLTPCGPLRALINLAQKRQDPIPGLLYEANVGPVNEDADHVRDTFVSSARPRGEAATAAVGVPAAVAATGNQSPAAGRSTSMTPTAAGGTWRAGKRPCACRPTRTRHSPAHNDCVCVCTRARARKYVQGQVQASGHPRITVKRQQ
ncbi:hypothetical protein EON66_08135 [archaeon]|nr:MAG: hypothetical protein EON66_08135 [archaeon]